MIRGACDLKITTCICRRSEPVVYSYLPTLSPGCDDKAPCNIGFQEQGVCTSAATLLI